MEEESDNERGEESMDERKESSSENNTQDNLVRGISNDPPNRDKINKKFTLEKVNLAIMNVRGLKSMSLAVSNICNTVRRVSELLNKEHKKQKESLKKLLSPTSMPRSYC